MLERSGVARTPRQEEDLVTNSQPALIPGVVDRRPARAVKTTYSVVLTPTADRTLITVMESRWMGGHKVPKLVGSFSVSAAAEADWALGGPAVLPLVLSAVAAYLEA